ncbi:MAG TPA: MFS transporter [Bryobacteraceae bacterium]|nr:MFS transporter [Bryobacteraceae bacterium]
MPPGSVAATERRSILGTNVRWAVCGLLFFATTVNYVDRQVLGILKPVLERELHWTESDYGSIVSFFQLAYALMMPFAGRAMDWLGTRLGYALAVAVWSAASMLHSLASTPFQFSAARFALGIGEASNFPAAIKTVADWFPRRERSFATGIFNSGSNIGAIVAPLAVPIVAAHFGWRASFIFTGSLDVVWLIVWLSFYRRPSEHKLLTAEERRLIESGSEHEAQTRVPYSRLITKRPAWAFLVGKLLTDPVWWFYLFWVPGFLHDKYNLDLVHLGPPLVMIYVVADIGSVFGGWLPKKLAAHGMDLSKARKTAMLICAAAVVPVAGVMYTGGNLWLTVALISLATGAHQGWSANLFTIPSDTFPRPAVGSVVGLGGMGGALGGVVVAKIVGWWLDYSHQTYGPLFLAAGSMYLIALLLIHVLVPRIRQIEV